MKFMLMMNMKTDAASQADGIMTWPNEDIQRHIQFMTNLNKELRQAGEFIAAEGLAWPSEAKLVRAAKDGAPDTDGVFPESKEFLIGYWILEVASLDRACAIAAQISLAPGKAAQPLYLAIEVRQIMSGPPEM